MILLSQKESLSSDGLFLLDVYVRVVSLIFAR